MATTKEKQTFSKLILRLLWKMKENDWENTRAAWMLWQMWDNEPITILVADRDLKSFSADRITVSPHIPYEVVFESQL